MNTGATAPGSAPPHPALKYFLLIGLGIIWGTSFTFLGVAVRTVPPITTASCRIIVGGGILLLAALLTRQQFPRRREDWLMIAGFALAGNAGPFLLLAFGQSYIDSSLAAILIAGTPLFTLLIAHLATHDEKITLPKGVGVALGFAGILMLLGPAAFGGPAGRPGANFCGQAMIVGAGLGFEIGRASCRERV